MKAARTQFDDGRLTNAVATPTCSSCCCCCCCLASAISTSAIAASRVKYEGERSGSFLTPLAVLLAALYLPAVGLLLKGVESLLAIYCIPASYGRCLDFYDLGPSFVIAGVMVAIAFFYLLFRLAKGRKPLINSLKFVAGFTLAIAIEFYLGMHLILATGRLALMIYLVIVLVTILIALAKNKDSLFRLKQKDRDDEMRERAEKLGIGQSDFIK